MKIQFLGSGGNSPIPMPTCTCEICHEARAEGIPYARRGNSLYLDDLNAIVDAPEFIFSSLNREEIHDIDYVFLTHWHPDHTNGLRVLQSRDYGAMDPRAHDMREIYTRNQPTLVTTRAVYERVQQPFGQLDYYINGSEFANVHFVDEEPLRIDEYEINSVHYATSGEAIDATGFVIEGRNETVVLTTDDAAYLDENKLPANIDVAVFECGLFTHDPNGRELLSTRDRQRYESEILHDEVLDRIRRLSPDRTFLTEIEHLTGRSYDDFTALESSYDSIRFAFDGLCINV